MTPDRIINIPMDRFKISPYLLLKQRIKALMTERKYQDDRIRTLKGRVTRLKNENIKLKEQINDSKLKAV